MEEKGSVTSVLFLSCLPHAKSDVACTFCDDIAPKQKGQALPSDRYNNTIVMGCQQRKTDWFALIRTGEYNVLQEQVFRNKGSGKRHRSLGKA